MESLSKNGNRGQAEFRGNVLLDRLHRVKYHILSPAAAILLPGSHGDRI
jgi:hypothetical protein